MAEQTTKGSNYSMIPIDSISKNNIECIDLLIGENILGRGPFLKISDKRISRNHAVIIINKNSIKIKSTHTNPTFVSRADCDKTIFLNKEEECELTRDDIISLLQNEFKYKLSHTQATPDTPIMEQTQHSPITTSIDTTIDNSINDTIVEDITVNSPLPSNNSTSSKPRIIPSWLTSIASNSNAKKSHESSSKNEIKKSQNKELKLKRESTLEYNINSSAGSYNIASLEGDNDNNKSLNDCSLIKASKNINNNNNNINNNNNTNNNNNNDNDNNGNGNVLTTTTTPTTTITTTTTTTTTTTPPTISTSIITTTAITAPISVTPTPTGTTISTTKTPPVASATTVSASTHIVPDRDLNSENKALSASSNGAVKSLPLCPYGEKCYRKNPDHLKQYSHNIQNKICPYGSKCYRKNPDHFTEYTHSNKRSTRNKKSSAVKKIKKSVLDGESDDDGVPNSYDRDDSFIDNTSGSESESYSDATSSDGWAPSDDNIRELKSEAKDFMNNSKMLK